MIGVQFPVWAGIFVFATTSSRLWGQPNILSNWWRVPLCGGEVATAWSLLLTSIYFQV